MDVDAGADVAPAADEESTSSFDAAVGAMCGKRKREEEEAEEGREESRQAACAEGAIAAGPGIGLL
eukprot:2492613-Prymnesium_polylepis.1